MHDIFIFRCVLFRGNSIILDLNIVHKCFLFSSVYFCWFFDTFYEMSRYTLLADMKRRSRGRSSVTARSKRSRRFHGRIGPRRWSGTTNYSLPFHRSNTYLPITHIIRTRTRRWAIRTCPRLIRNMLIATYLASRRGQITCRIKTR